jgi:hypothetical protein
MRTIRIIVNCLAMAILLGVPVAAEVPGFLSYQGQLLDDQGRPINATVDLKVTVFSDESGLDSLWSETHTGVLVEDGLFNLKMGSQEAFPVDVFDGSVRYLGLQMDGGPMSTPLVAILSVAYSLRSSSADTAAYAHAGPGSGVTGWVDDGATVRLDNATDQVGIGTAETDERLHVENSAGYKGRAFLQVQTSHLTEWGECGLRFKTPANTWHFRMDDYTNNNLPDSGALSLRSQNTGREAMTWTEAGDVGIGDVTPDARLDVNGDLAVRGAYRGDISSASGSDGAPFPRPAYNSGWVEVTAGELDTLYHGVGGDADNYVVDLQFKDTYRDEIHIQYHGLLQSTYGNMNGWAYLGLNDSTIILYRGVSDHPDNVARIRIWVIE